MPKSEVRSPKSERAEVRGPNASLVRGPEGRANYACVTFGPLTSDLFVGGVPSRRWVGQDCSGFNRDEGVAPTGYNRGSIALLVGTLRLFDVEKRTNEVIGLRASAAFGLRLFGP